MKKWHYRLNPWGTVSWVAERRYFLSLAWYPISEPTTYERAERAILWDIEANSRKIVVKEEWK